MEINKNEIKQANRKAIPKFILLMTVCAVIGGIIGFCAAKYGFDSLTGGIKSAGAYFGIKIAPWILLAMAISLPLICVPLCKGAKKLLKGWNGDDESVSDLIEGKISLAIWISGSFIIVSYFLIAAVYSGGFSLFDEKKTAIMLLVSIASFLCIMVETIVIQQICVDTAKQVNPEKNGSVYDMKFQKKWLESCDEAEKIMIGKCAYKAYIATNNVCALLAILTTVCALIFDIGFLPSLVICIIWITNQSVYCREGMRLSKAGNMIDR